MKITDLIPDSGRTIAYRPELRKIAGSVNAALLLCQLIYWTGRQASESGWVYKRARLCADDPAGTCDPSNQSIEFETGLSYKEQRAARQQLRRRGLLHERHDRFKHTLWFQVDLEAVENAWDAQYGQLPSGQVASARRSTGSCPSGSSLNGNYTDDTQTTTQKPAATRSARLIGEESIPTSPLRALQHPMIQLFQETCGRVPGTRDYAAVIELMQHFHALHGEGTAAFLRPYWLTWSTRTRSSDGQPYDPGSLTWLSEWAMNTHIPPIHGGKHARNRSARSRHSRHPGTRSGSSRSPVPQRGAPAAADQAAARRINERRRGQVQALP